MEKIFIVWQDYDGVYMETFNCEEKDKAEERCADIMAKGDKYGTQIHGIIQGKGLTIKPIEVVSKVSLT